MTNDLNARLFVLGEMASPTPLPTGSGKPFMCVHRFILC